MLRLLTKEEMEEMMNAENLRKIEEKKELATMLGECSGMPAIFNNPPSIYTQEQLKDLRTIEYLIESKVIVTE